MLHEPLKEHCVLRRINQLVLKMCCVLKLPVRPSCPKSFTCTLCSTRLQHALLHSMHPASARERRPPRWLPVRAQVGDQSDFVTAFSRALAETAPRLGPALSALHFRYFADKLAASF